MLNRLFVDNYKCFQNFELLPGRVSLLVGLNGSGKSAIFEILTSIRDLVLDNVGVEERFPAASRTRWDSRTTQRFELGLQVENDRFAYHLSVVHDLDGGPSRISTELVSLDSRPLFEFRDGVVCFYRNDGTVSTQFAYRGSRSFLPQVEERAETREIVRFLRALERIWILAIDPAAIDETSESEDDWLDADASNFASWYRTIANEMPDRLPELFASLREVIPGFRSMKLPSARGKSRELTVVCSLDGATFDLGFDELSLGQRKLVVLYTLLIGGPLDAGCLLLDEPESHLALQEIQPWLSELLNSLTNSGQLIVASHHPETVDYLAAETAYLLERPNGGPVRAVRQPFERATGLAASDQLMSGTLGPVRSGNADEDSALR